MIRGCDLWGGAPDMEQATWSTGTGGVEFEREGNATRPGWTNHGIEGGQLYGCRFDLWSEIKVMPDVREKGYRLIRVRKVIGGKKLVHITEDAGLPESRRGLDDG